VSYSVSRLQAAIGLPLLEIAGRKAVLTPHGRTLLHRARALLRDLDTLESLAAREIRTEPSDLRVFVATTPPALGAASLDL